MIIYDKRFKEFRTETILYSQPKNFMHPKELMKAENNLNIGIQSRLNISDFRRQQIISYINMATRGPEDVCDMLKEIPLNFKGNDKYFAVYIVTLFIIHHSDKFKKEKQETFLDDMWQKAAQCFGLDLDYLLKILSGLLKKDTLIEVINGSFKDNEKIVLLFLFYLSMLGSLRVEVR